MKTTMDCRTLGESKSNYNTNASVRQMRQSDLSAPTHESGISSSYERTYGNEMEQDATAYRNRTTTYQSVPETYTRRKSVSGGKIAAGVIAGASVGVLAGILLAPEKGRDLRKQVKNSASRLGDKVTKSFNSTKDKVTSWTSKSNSSHGYVQPSPYTDPTKHSHAEVNSMINDPALGPTGGTNMQRCL